MQDNPVVKFRKAVSDNKKKILGKIREATGRLTQKQTYVLLAILFTAFVAVDVIYIVRGFRGQGGQLEIQHVRAVEVEQTNNKENDTDTGNETGSGEDAGTDAGAGE